MSVLVKQITVDHNVLVIDSVLENYVIHKQLQLDIHNIVVLYTMFVVVFTQIRQVVQHFRDSVIVIQDILITLDSLVMVQVIVFVIMMLYEYVLVYKFYLDIVMVT